MSRHNPKPVYERIMQRVDTSDPDACWLWPGALDTGGHGIAKDSDGRLVGVHRAVYEHDVGPIPPGHDVHHECRARPCVNPCHLIALSRADHRSVHAAERTTCPSGHPYDGRNSTQRLCSTCRRAAWRRWKARQTATT